MEPPVLKLEYASRTTPPEGGRARYSLPVALLLLLNTLAGGALVWFGFLYLSDEPSDGGMLIGAGALLCLVVLSELSRPQPRWRRAAVLLFGALSLQVTLAVVLIGRQLPEARAAVDRLSYIDERNYRDASEEARRQMRLESTLELDLGAGALGMALLTYVGVRLMTNKPSEAHPSNS